MNPFWYLICSYRFLLVLICFTVVLFRCLAVSPNFEIAKNNMAIALTDLGTKVGFIISIMHKCPYCVILLNGIVGVCKLDLVYIIRNWDII